MSLNDMANSSNERREQMIMRLRNLFLQQKVCTVQSAVNVLSMTETTIKKYCLDGDIPLWDTVKGKSVVPVTYKNKPKWLV